jgi:hypothetical protein
MRFVFLIFIFLLNPAFSQDEDQEAIDKLVQEKQKQSESFHKIEKGTDAMTSVPSSLVDEMKKLGHQSLTPQAILDPKMVDTFKIMIYQSGFHTMSRDQAKAMIIANVKGKFLEKVFTTFPKFLDISADIMIDRKALPNFLDIIKRQNDLKFFLGISLFLFILSFFLKKVFIPKNARFFHSLFISLTITVFMTAGTFGIFFLMFQKELGPMIEVIKKTI